MYKSIVKMKNDKLFIKRPNNEMFISKIDDILYIKLFGKTISIMVKGCEKITFYYESGMDSEHDYKIIEEAIEEYHKNSIL